jgi:hypothetical protein
VSDRAEAPYEFVVLDDGVLDAWMDDSVEAREHQRNVRLISTGGSEKSRAC